MNSARLLAMPYQLTRAPLAVFDRRIARRLPENSLPRVAFDRALGTYDQLAGRLLRNTAITQSGVDRMERSGKLARAAVLEREAADRRDQAVAVGTDGYQTAQQKRAAAQDRRSSGLAEAAVAERHGKQAAARNARARAQADKEQADVHARQRVSAIEEGVQRVEDAADAQKKSAQRTAKAKLQNAAETKSDAAATRRDAARLSQLTDAQRRSRKRNTSN